MIFFPCSLYSPPFVICYHMYLRRRQRTGMYLCPSGVGSTLLAMVKPLLPDWNVQWQEAGTSYTLESERQLYGCSLVPIENKIKSKNKNKTLHGRTLIWRQSKAIAILLPTHQGCEIEEIFEIFLHLLNQNLMLRKIREATENLAMIMWQSLLFVDVI